MREISHFTLRAAFLSARLKRTSEGTTTHLLPNPGVNDLISTVPAPRVLILFQSGSCNAGTNYPLRVDVKPMADSPDANMSRDRIPPAWPRKY